MNILIQGMEMPIKCAKCPIADISAEYYFCEKIDWFGKERPSDCPLIELPPHGRLVDLDKMINDFWDCDSMIIGNYELEKIKTVIEGSET